MALHPSLHAFERFLWLFTKVTLPFVLIIFLVHFIVVGRGFVDGPSMEPSFIDDDTFYINKIYYLSHSPKRLDVIQYIDEKENYIIKRIVGMPNETVYIKQGKVFVASPGKSETEAFVLDESQYLADDTFTKPGGLGELNQMITAGKNEYILLGDNRANSIDSRFKGSVHRSKITGKVSKTIPELFYD